MSDDFAQFRETYITECLELLEQMESLLLGLNGETASRDELDAIFRCAHSIKGGAGAFGFTAIARFTHVLEALLDEMREGRIQPAREIIDLLLRARDVVMAMVVAARDGTPLAEDFGAGEREELERAARKAPVVSAPADTQVALAAGGNARYRIRFTPRRDLLLHGNEPLLLLREVARLGEAEITCDTAALPPLNEMDPEACYLSWNVDLLTDKGEAAIRELFEFVEDECDLSIEAAQETPPATAEVIAFQPTVSNKDKAPTTPAAESAATSIRVDIGKVDRLINMVGEVVIVQGMLALQSRQLPEKMFTELQEGIEDLTQHIRELQEAVMAIRMQPVKSIFSRMPRLVRDVAGKLGKEIRLETLGETTEVDKTIIEQLSDPLTHMIRNACDHGVETPEARRASGKPEQGVILLSAKHQSGKIVIEVADDGKGIDRERVLRKAIEKGVVEPNASLSPQDIDQLIFAAGFSTADQVSDISGRGVGMDVVRRNIEAIGGTVTIANRPGYGTTMSIELPLTLAILDGMVVRVGTEQYIIPIASIIETLRPAAHEVRRLAEGGVVVHVRGEFTPTISLHELFGVKGAQADASKALVVLVENGASAMGIVVDELVGQQQVVIKALEENTDRVEGISGATILGDGKVSLILDITGLARMCRQSGQLKMSA